MPIKVSRTAMSTAYEAPYLTLPQADRSEHVSACIGTQSTLRNLMLGLPTTSRMVAIIGMRIAGKCFSYIRW